MVKYLEGKMFKEWLKFIPPGSFSWERRRLTGKHVAAYSFLTREIRMACANLCSLVTTIGNSTMLCQGQFRLDKRKKFFSGSWSGAGMDSPEQRSWLRSSRVQDELRQNSYTYGLSFGWSCVEPGLALIILVNPLRLGIVYDSMTS